MMHSACLVLSLLFLGSTTAEWDLGVVTSSSLELLDHRPSSRPLYSAQLGVRNVTALTYDPLLLHHYFAASGHQTASIFRVQVSRDGRTGPVEPLVKKQAKPVLGLAYDAKSTTVFWTSGKQIFQSQLDLDVLTDAKVLHDFPDDYPHSIAVEPCTRYIYWSYLHTHIDRSLMDGTKRERIVTDLYMPVAISISQAERMIYWADEGPGYNYRIGRALLDGSNKEIIFEDKYQQPTSLVVVPMSLHDSRVYWTDRGNRELWTFDKNQTIAESIHTFDQQIYAVVTAYPFQHLDKHVCSELIAMRDQVPNSIISPTVGSCVHGTYSSSSASCVCDPGYIGSLCETTVCHNYCLFGDCSLRNGQATCRCPAGKSGRRCEVDQCSGYCFQGSCSNKNNTLRCSCDPGWYGLRCNYSQQFCTFACEAGFAQDTCSCNLSHTAALTSSDNPQEYKIGFMVTSGLCLLLSVALIGVVIKAWKLGKRPRVKRTYKVTPNRDSAPQPARTSPDCQIAIENCCNMNICETPCYEPELRPPGGKSKKEEKRGLLKEMEVQPDLGQTF